MHVFDKKAFHNMVFILTISCEMAMLINYPILWTFYTYGHFPIPYFCMDILFPMDIFLYEHYPIWTSDLMDNLQIHLIFDLQALLDAKNNVIFHLHIRNS